MCNSMSATPTPFDHSRDQGMEGPPEGLPRFNMRDWAELGQR